MAPSVSESDGSGTTSSGSISIIEPSPVQRGQAPCGALNENERGSSSGIESPQCREGERSGGGGGTGWGCGWSWGGVGGGGGGGEGFGTVSISMMPSASATAVSTESASRL